MPPLRNTNARMPWRANTRAASQAHAADPATTTGAHHGHGDGERDGETVA